MLNFLQGSTLPPGKNAARSSNRSYALRLILILIISAYLQAHGQLLGQTQARSLSLEENFTLDRGATLHQSKDGQYWIGTQKGLFRTNGQRVWKYQINDPASAIKHTQNIQSAILNDGKEKLWFSTYSALHRFDPVTETFITRQVKDNDTPIEDSYRVFYYNAELGQLWLLAGSRLWSYDIKADEFHPLSAVSNAAVFSVYEDTVKNTTYIYGAGWMYEWFEVTEIDQNGRMVSYRDLPVNGAVLVSCPISSDSVLIGTANGVSLVLIQEDSVQVTPLAFGNTGGGVFDIKRKSNGLFLLCDLSHGVFELDLYEKELRPVFKNEYRFEKIFSVNHGDWAVSQPKQQFVILSDDSPLINYEVLPSEQDKIIDLKQDESGSLFILKENGKIFRKTIHSYGWKEFNKEAPSIIEYGAALSLGITNNLLTVLHNKGIVAYKKNGALENKYSTSEKLLNGLTGRPDGQQFVLAEDGMRRYENHGDTLKTFIEPKLAFPDEKYGLSNCFALEDGSILLNYKGQNLFHVVYSTSSGYQIKRKTKIPGYSLSAISGDDNKIYVGTNNGIYELDGNHSSPLLPNDERLAGISANSLVIDNDKNLWVGTQKGLYSVNLQTKRMAFFSEADGLPSSSFSGTPAILRQDGSIIIATEKGIITFQPKSLLSQRQSINPYIEKIWINDVLHLQDTASAYATKIDLPSKKNTIFIKIDHLLADDSPVAGMHFQLLGYENFPSEVKVPYTIRYPNLPPGQYTLELTAINRNGLPSGKKRLAIIIRPPFTQTVLFYILCTCALALIAAAIYIAGLRRERLKQQRLSEQQARLAAERDRIAGEVHDDLGGQISSILYLSEEMLLTGTTTDNAYELNRIHELSRTSLQNVRDIIFALDNRRATLAALGEQLRGAGTEFFTDRKIAFTCTDTFARPDFYLTSRQKRNLTLIVKEAWHNTSKHAAATAVSLDISQANGTLHLTCTDNGKGFTSTKSDKATGGYGLDNMTEKADAIGAIASLDSAPGQGTTLRITWPLPNQDQ